MAVVQAKPEAARKEEPQAPRVDERLLRPGKYEVTPETQFTVVIHSRCKDGRWIIMTGPGKGIETEKVVFRMWTYDEMVEMRKMATTYDAQKRIHMIDNDALNRLKIQRLMVSWTFDSENPRLRIQHVQGVMTDESWAAFKRLQTNISDYIIGEMNKVFEFNG
jgi:hypothetical protein